MKSNTKPIALLVDDDHDYLDQMAMWFTSEGFKVLTAGSEVEARDHLAHHRPSVAVLDLMMERLDAGFGLAHLIKKMDATIPVLLITGVASETGLDFESTGAEGSSWIKADAILAKPVRLEQVRRELDRLEVRRG